MNIQFNIMMQIMSHYFKNFIIKTFFTAILVFFDILKKQFHENFVFKL
jgi:hypothetical protein